MEATLPMFEPAKRPHGTMTDQEVDEFTSLIVWGLDNAETIDGREWKAFEPLSLQAAARFLGVRVKRARVAFATPKFRDMFRSKMEQLRDGERARNLHVAMTIRDTEGDGLAPDRTVQLKAIATIEGQTKSGVNVSVNVNNQTNIAQVQPGYVIKLRPTQSPVEGLPAGLLVQGAMPEVDIPISGREPVTVEHE